MKCVVQRVSRASVAIKGGVKGGVEGKVAGEVGRGLMVLVGVAVGDTASDAEYMASKVVGLRVFSDDGGRMNLSVKEAGGAVLLVSQFTLLGDTRKGRRPSFGGAESSERAEELIGELASRMRALGVEVEVGVFGAHMEVELVNDGPVTLVVDSKEGK